MRFIAVILSVSAALMNRWSDSTEVYSNLRESNCRRSSASPSPVKEAIELSPHAGILNLTGPICYLGAMQDGTRISVIRRGSPTTST
jgi:hypothetical protein